MQQTQHVIEHVAHLVLVCFGRSVWYSKKLVPLNQSKGNHISYTTSLINRHMNESCSVRNVIDLNTTSYIITNRMPNKKLHQNHR